MPNCQHKEKSGFKCAELSIQDVRKIHHKYYLNCDLTSKKNYILQHVNVSTAKRSRLPQGIVSRKKVSTMFYLPKQREGKTTNIKVCRAAFLRILQESRNRIQNLCQKYLEQGITPPETRGGARNLEKYEIKRQSVKDFIKTFRPVQKHYCRTKNTVRQYLSSELSITKMWKLYDETHPNADFKVNFEFFRTTFNENFNIGFDAPYVDKCSTCARLEYQISVEQDNAKKEKIKVELTCHKSRADKFYQLLKEENDSELILSYDCQKNLILPKIPDQAAYYKRQLYLYNFTICEGHSGSIQNRNNSFSYVWTEDEYAKASNQIVSAVHHRLQSSELNGVTIVKLFSDGCGGQNKNTAMVGMISYWLLTEAPKCVKKVLLYFPIVGHSFIPPDRVFGILERDFKSVSEIISPDEYIKLINKHCTVVHLGQECPVKDWKQGIEETHKVTTQWHFKFQKSKKIAFSRSKDGKKILVQGEPTYVFEGGKRRSLLKRGKALTKTCVPEVPRGNDIKPSKKKDVLYLLNLHFGKMWSDNPKLQYYRPILDFSNDQLEERNDNNDDEEEVLHDLEIPAEDEPIE